MVYKKAIIIIFLLLTVFRSHAQPPQLEEVVVTAQQREESLQDVSVSVTALGNEKLTDFGIARLEEVTAYVPNFVMSETGIGTNIYIRGIGSGINQGFEQSVGMYRDGIYYGRAQLSRAPLFDMERIEVLRGPQVTLFGNNSIGGAISMSATRPTDEFQGSFSILNDFDHGERELTTIVSGPVFDWLNARFALRALEFDGYIYNEILGEDEPSREYLTRRLVLDATPHDDLNFTLLIERSDFDVKGRQIVIFQDAESKSITTATNSYAKGVDVTGKTLAEILSGFDIIGGQTVVDTSDLETRHANKDFSINETNSYTLHSNLFIGDSQLTSITGWLDYSYGDACDCDFSGATLIGYESDEKYDQFSQELRFVSGWDLPFDLIAGIYYQEDELLFNDALIAEEDSALEELIRVVVGDDLADILTDVAGPRRFEQETSLASAFAQITLNITDSVRLMGGIRRSKTKKEASRRLFFTAADRVTALSEDDFNTTSLGYGLALSVSPHLEEGKREEWRNSYSMILEYDFNEDILIYLSKTRGFKAGGYDVRSNNATDIDNVLDYTGQPDRSIATAAFRPGTFEFEDEQAIAYELGLKTLLGGFAEINTTYFYTEIKDLQVSVFDGGVGFNVSNAAEAVTQGVEVDFRLALTENWSMNGSLAWLDFEFKDYKDGLCTAENRLRIRAKEAGTFTSVTLPGEDGIIGSPAIDDIVVNTLNDGSCTEIAGQISSGVGTRYNTDLTGSTNQYVASYSGSLSVNYEAPVFKNMLFKSSLDVNFTDDYNPTQNLDPIAEQSGYEIYNLRLALAGDLTNGGNWELVLLGRNIFNEQVITYANDVPLATSQFGTVTKYGFVQRTKSWAAQIRLAY